MTDGTQRTDSAASSPAGAPQPSQGPEQPRWGGRVLPANTGRSSEADGSRERGGGNARDGAGDTDQELGRRVHHQRAAGSRLAFDDDWPPERSPSGVALWFWWTVATVLGWALAGAGVGAVFQQSDATPLQYVFVPLIALFQWLLLRRHFARASWWLVATAGGTLMAALIYAALLALPESAFGAPTSGLRTGTSDLTDGIAIATAQWLVLRRTVRGASLWLPATISPLALFGWLDYQRGAAAAELIDNLSRQDQIGLAAVNTAIIGLFVGVLTGAVLMRLVEEPRHAEDVVAGDQRPVA